MEFLAKLVPIFTSYGKIEEIREEEFKKGEEFGYEEGVRDAYAQKFDQTEGLTEEEEREIWRFLEERNLVICYDAMRGGLRVRKGPELKPRSAGASKINHK